MDDRQLLQLLQTDPQSGWSTLVSQYSGLLYYVIRGRLGQRAVPEDIEDLVSEVFLQAYQQWHRFEPSKGSIKTYLATIAMRRAVDFVRTYKSSIPFEEATQESEEAVDTDPSELLLQDEDRKRILTAIDKLPLTDRKLILGRYFFGMSAKELGELHNLSVDAVHQRLHRLRKKLKQLLQEKEDRHEKRNLSIPNG